MTTQYKYNTPGRCRKCNHITFRMGQTAAIPPRELCPICGYSNWDMKSFSYNPDLAVR